MHVDSGFLGFPNHLKSNIISLSPFLPFFTYHHFLSCISLCRWNMFYQQATTTVAAPVTASNTTGATGASASSGTGGSGDGTGGAGTNTATLGGSAGAGTNPANSGVNGNSGGLGQNGGSGTGNLGAQGTVAGSLGSSNGNGRGEGEDDEKETTTDAPNTDTSVATTASLNFSAVKSPDAGTRGGQACKSSQVAAGSQSGVCVSENSVSTSCTQGILAIASQCRFFQKCCIILGK